MCSLITASHTELIQLPKLTTIIWISSNTTYDPSYTVNLRTPMMIWADSLLSESRLPVETLCGASSWARSLNSLEKWSNQVTGDARQNVRTSKTPTVMQRWGWCAGSVVTKLWREHTSKKRSSVRISEPQVRIQLRLRFSKILNSIITVNWSSSENVREFLAVPL